MSGISLDDALTVTRAVIAAGSDQGKALAVVVVDAGGGIVASARMDGAGPSLIELARRKAATAVQFRAPLSAVVESVRQDTVILQALNSSPDLVLLPGAAPLSVEGEIVGALGVSGGHYSEDQAIVDAIVANRGDA